MPSASVGRRVLSYLGPFVKNCFARCNTRFMNHEQLLLSRAVSVNHTEKQAHKSAMPAVLCYEGRVQWHISHTDPPRCSHSTSALIMALQCTALGQDYACTRFVTCMCTTLSKSPEGVASYLPVSQIGKHTWQIHVLYNTPVQDNPLYAGILGTSFCSWLCSWLRGLSAGSILRRPPRVGLLRRPDPAWHGL